MSTWQRWALGGLAVLVTVITVVFSSRNSRPTQTDSPNNNAPTTETASGRSAQFPAWTTAGLTYFNPTDGRFERITNNKTEMLTAVSLPFNEAVYDPTGALVAIRTAQEDATEPWSIVVLSTGQTLATLNPSVEALAFSPDGKRIIYHYRDEAVSNLSTANNDGSEWHQVLDVPRTLGKLWWLTPETRVIYQDWEAPTANYLVGLSSKSRETTGPGNQEIRPSPVGTHVVLGNVGGNNTPEPELTLIQVAAEGITRSTTLPYATLPTLTAWDSRGDALYLITPLFGSPELVRFSPSTGEASTIASPTQLQELIDGNPADVELIAVSQGALYFVIDEELKSAKLPE